MRNVTLKQLRTFAAVARANTMVQAAQTLHITPPAVTIQMQLLEESVGIALIERVAGRTQLTAAGREVLGAAARIDQILADCASAIQSIKGLEGGEVTLGVVSTAKYFAPRALAAFARAHPAIDVRLLIGNRGEIIEALEQYRIDAAVMGRPPESLDVEQDILGDHPHIIIAAPDHPMGRRSRLPVQDLAGETFLVRETGSGTRTVMERLFAEQRISPRIGMQIASNETIKQAVIAGLGIAVISAHTVATEIAAGQLIALDVAGFPIVRQWFVVKPRERRSSPAAAALRSFLVSEGPRFLPATIAAAPSRIGNAARNGAKHSPAAGDGTSAAPPSGTTSKPAERTAGRSSRKKG